MNAAPRARAGALSGILNTTRGLGTALGVAVAGLIYTVAARPAEIAASAGAARTAAGDLPVTLASRGLTVTLLALAAVALGTAALASRRTLSP